MRYDEIKTAEGMIDYLIDCTLATVVTMIDKKKMSKWEFERQCGIAQKAIDFLGVNYEYQSRAGDFAKSKISVIDFYSSMRELWMNKHN